MHRHKKSPRRAGRDLAIGGGGEPMARGLDGDLRHGGLSLDGGAGEGQRRRQQRREQAADGEGGEDAVEALA